MINYFLVVNRFNTLQPLILKPLLNNIFNIILKASVLVFLLNFSNDCFFKLKLRHLSIFSTFNFKPGTALFKTSEPNKCWKDLKNELLQWLQEFHLLYTDRSNFRWSLWWRCLFQFQVRVRTYLKTYKNITQISYFESSQRKGHFKVKKRFFQL